MTRRPKARRTTAKQRVLAVYPDAKLYPATRLMMSRIWAGDLHLASHITARQAWADAASRLAAKTRRKT